MSFSQQEIIRYLASVISIARIDKRVSPREMDGFALVQSKIGAKKTDLTKAHYMAESPQFRLEPLSRFAANVQLLEDMIFIALIDNGSISEESLIHEFAKSAGVSGSQVDRIINDVKVALTSNTANRTCPNCCREISSQAKFCPECGALIAEVEKAAIINIEYEIPKDGISIEFAESTASGFPEAVKIANSAPVRGTCMRAKKTWYLASWPLSDISDAGRLVECLKGMRNRKVYIDGLETSWDDVFGFSWCAEQRNTAFKPVEYCFGLDENRLNIWGCKQSRMDWVDWAPWFTYGSFRKKGLLNNQIVFEFDKVRIKHDLQTNLYRFRYCPFMNTKLIEAVVNAFPSEVTPSTKGLWTYKRDYNESPGAIKVQVREGKGSYAYTDEYYSNGVSPKSLTLGIDILKTALKKIGLDYPCIASIPDVSEQEPKRKDDDSLEERVLCSDGACIGVIGPDGRCKVCGKPYQPDDR